MSNSTVSLLMSSSSSILSKASIVSRKCGGSTNFATGLIPMDWLRLSYDITLNLLEGLSLMWSSPEKSESSPKESSAKVFLLSFLLIMIVLDRALRILNSEESSFFSMLTFGWNETPFFFGLGTGFYSTSLEELDMNLTYVVFCYLFCVTGFFRISLPCFPLFIFSAAALNGSNSDLAGASIF